MEFNPPCEHLQTFFLEFSRNERRECKDAEWIVAITRFLSRHESSTPKNILSQTS